MTVYHFKDRLINPQKHPWGFRAWRPEWIVGTDFNRNRTIIYRPYRLGGYWVAGDCVVPPTNKATGRWVRSGTGLVWSSTQLPTIYSNLEAFAHDGTRWIGAGNAHTTRNNVGISLTMSSWSMQNVSSRNFNGMAYSPVLDMFIATYATGAHTSDDSGATWTQPTLAHASGIALVVWETVTVGGRFFIFSNTGAAQISPDGVSWTAVSTSLTGTPVGAAGMEIAGVPTLFVACSNGVVVKTTNGSTYTTATSLSGTAQSFAGDGYSILMATIDDGSIDISYDYGVTWRNFTPEHQWEDGVKHHYIAYGDGMWLHLGEDLTSSSCRPAIAYDPYFIP
jgi:hypothetical protein